MTIVEAVARGAAANGVAAAQLVEIADLQRAFLVRQNQRLPVDFENCSSTATLRKTFRSRRMIILFSTR